MKLCKDSYVAILQDVGVLAPLLRRFHAGVLNIPSSGQHETQG